MNAPAHPPAGSTNATIFVIDDDASVRRSLARLFSSLGFKVTACASGEEFLHLLTPDMQGCVITDLRMGGISGLELQEAVKLRNELLRIIFITGHGDLSTGIRAMKGGAVDFLTKPVDSRVLLDAVYRALGASAAANRQEAELAEIRERLAQLTPREFEVLRHVVAGKSNRQIADALDTMEKTVRLHRSRIMEKLAISADNELQRLAERARIAPP
jgi:FixJ family two-component response regulator